MDMAGKVAVLLLVVGISYVAATCYKPDWWYGKANWYGRSKPWCPGKQAEIYSPLVLWETELLTSIPKPDQPVKAGDPGVFWGKVTCPADDQKMVVGDCSATGLYIYDIHGHGKPDRYSRPRGAPTPGAAEDATETTAGGDRRKDDGLVNWTIVCNIVKPCGDYGVGTITAVGRSAGSNGKSPGRWAIVGGTGAYAALAARGGEVYNALNRDNIWTYTWRFIRDKY